MDYGGKTLAIVGQATPDFWIAIILIWVFAVTLGWLPTSGKGDWQHLVLPVLVLALPSAATLRLMRSAMLNQLDSEYVKLARIKGLPEWKIIWKHAFRNAAIVPLTFMGVVIGQLVSGSIVVETIFAWPGMGQLAIQAINARDYHVVQALALMGSTILILMHLVTGHCLRIRGSAHPLYADKPVVPREEPSGDPLPAGRKAAHWRSHRLASRGSWKACAVCPTSGCSSC